MPDTKTAFVYPSRVETLATPMTATRSFDFQIVGLPDKPGVDLSTDSPWINLTAITPTYFRATAVLSDATPDNGTGLIRIVPRDGNTAPLTAQIVVGGLGQPEGTRKAESGS